MVATVRARAQGAPVIDATNLDAALAVTMELVRRAASSAAPG